MIKKLLLVLGLMLLMALSAWAGFYLHNMRLTDSAKPAIESIVEEKPALLSNQAITLGAPVPDFSLLDIQGNRRSLSAWKGKVVVINFWATWCPPCVEEIPMFVKLQQRYAEQGLQFVGIALQQPHEVLDFVERYQVNYPILAGELEVIKLAESLGNDIGGLPYTVVLDRAGGIYFAKAGPLSREQAEEVITALL